MAAAIDNLNEFIQSFNSELGNNFPKFNEDLRRSRKQKGGKTVFHWILVFFALVFILVMHWQKHGLLHCWKTLKGAVCKHHSWVFKQQGTWSVWYILFLLHLLWLHCNALVTLLSYASSYTLNRSMYIFLCLQWRSCHLNNLFRKLLCYSFFHSFFFFWIMYISSLFKLGSHAY